MLLKKQYIFVEYIGGRLGEFIPVLQVQQNLDHNKLFSKSQFNIVKLVDTSTMALTCHFFLKKE